jgi:Leucine-rich repeat (LRR) protein
MRHNLYTTLPRNAFTAFRNLRTINLNGNRLDFLPSNAFRSLTSLNTLEIADCGLGSINYRWFDDLQNLAILEVDANGITELPNAVFDLPHLLNLGLAGNRLAELNSDAFGRSLESLVSIRAENNAIDAIDARIIDNASGLFSLALSGNVCVDVDFIEVQENIEAVREHLAGCFENFAGAEK